MEIVAIISSIFLPVLASSCPTWYDARRFHAHTRLSINKFCSVQTKQCQPVFENAADLFHELGVRAFVRHTKTAGEGTWWRSQSGPPESWHEFVRETQRDLPKEFADKAHKNDQRVIFYHYPRVSEYYGSIDNGSWLNRNSKGHPISGPRGHGLCVNSPWRQVYKQQVLELVDFGADGFYFDEIPQPAEGCWCRWCRAKFRNWTGSDLYPAKVNKSDPLYKKLLEFNTQSVLEHYDEINQAVANRSRNVVTLVSLAQVPCANDGGGIFETARMMNATAQTAAKTEFKTSDRGSCIAEFTSKDAKLYGDGFQEGVMLAWGWALSRDAAAGRSPHVWTPSLPKAPLGSATAAPFALVAYGAVANPDNAETHIPNFKLFNATYRMGAKLDPYLNASRPLRWAGVFFSEKARNRYQPAHDVDAWTEYLFPIVSAWECLVRHRVPAGIITDWQLDGDITSPPDQTADYLLAQGYKAIVATLDGASEAQKETLAAFERKGGSIHWLHPSPEWAHKEKRFVMERVLYANLTKAVGLPPIHMTLGEELFNEGFTDTDPARMFREERPGFVSEKKREERIFKDLGADNFPTSSPGEGVAHPQAVSLRQNSTHVTVMITNDFTWIYGEKHDHPPAVEGMTLKINTVNVSAVTARNVLNGENLTVKRNGTAWEIHLPVLRQELTVQLTCSEPCWKGL